MNIIKDALLIIHFIGLALGLGTSLAFMFLGIASSKMEENEAQNFTLNTFALSKMGQIGLVLLVISGLFLMTTYRRGLTTTPLLIAKLALVLVLFVLIGNIVLPLKKRKKVIRKLTLKK